MLARLMLVAIDLVLSGEGVGLETARDLIREVRHAYPEVLAEEQCEVARRGGWDDACRDSRRANS
jgi:hypothetical protein